MKFKSKFTIVPRQITVVEFFLHNLADMLLETFQKMINQLKIHSWDISETFFYSTALNNLLVFLYKEIHLWNYCILNIIHTNRIPIEKKNWLDDQKTLLLTFSIYIWNYGFINSITCYEKIYFNLFINSFLFLIQFHSWYQENWNNGSNFIWIPIFKQT